MPAEKVNALGDGWEFPATTVRSLPVPASPKEIVAEPPAPLSHCTWLYELLYAANDKLDVKGIDVVRSNYPAAFRIFLGQVLRAILEAETREQVDDRILVFRDGKIIMDGSLDKLLESTLDYHQFQIEFDNLSDDLYKSLSNVATVVSPSRINNIFHFYGRERSVFFDIVRKASESFMIDLSVKKLGLRDLMDSEFAGGGLDWLEH